ncbi:DUF6233 domain-containing protein [Streptomyces sp. NPDC001156]
MPYGGLSPRPKVRPTRSRYGRSSRRCFPRSRRAAGRRASPSSRSARRSEPSPPSSTRTTARCPRARRPISAHEARVALSDPKLEACAFCRPDSELGILE